MSPSHYVRRQKMKGKDGKNLTYLGILSGALGQLIGIPVLIWIGLLIAGLVSETHKCLGHFVW